MTLLWKISLNSLKAYWKQPDISPILTFALTS